MPNSITISEPSLCHYSYNLKKAWFVHFDATDHSTGQTIRKQFRGGINSYKTKSERVLKAKSIIEFWKERIKAGWTPFEIEEEKAPEQSFNEAIDFGLSKVKASKSTRANYKSTANFVKAAAIECRLAKVPVTEIKRKHIKAILEKCVEINAWTNTSYNKHLGYLKAILTRVVDWEVIENNPAHKISNLPVAETEKYIPYTEAERKVISEHLFIHHYLFFVYVQVLYNTGIRPKEILALKIRDVDLINMEIKIVPVLEAENSKTKKIRRVPINKHLQPFLRELQLQNYPDDYYVFGSGRGMKGTKLGAMHPDYFKPSNIMVKRDTVTRLWKTIVIDKLKINKYLYAAKATGADAAILAGISLDALRNMYGHSNTRMTERYVSVLTGVYAKEIIDKSPGF